MNICIYAYIYIYAYMHIYIYMYIYVCIYPTYWGTPVYGDAFPTVGHPSNPNASARSGLSTCQKDLFGGIPPSGGAPPFWGIHPSVG